MLNSHTPKQLLSNYLLSFIFLLSLLFVLLPLYHLLFGFLHVNILLFLFLFLKVPQQTHSRLTIELKLYFLSLLFTITYSRTDHKVFEIASQFPYQFLLQISNKTMI